jgi:hypothetical protein
VLAQAVPNAAITVEGVHPVYKGRRVTARKKALRAALKKAVSQQAETLATAAGSSRRLSASARRTVLRAIGRTYRRYVTSYRVLQEGFVKKTAQNRSRYRVRLAVQVDRAALRRFIHQHAASPTPTARTGAPLPGLTPQLKIVLTAPNPTAFGATRPLQAALEVTLQNDGYKLAAANTPQAMIITLSARCTIAAHGAIGAANPNDGASSTYGVTVDCRAKLNTAKTSLAAFRTRASGLAKTALVARARAKTLAGRALAQKAKSFLQKRFSRCPHRVTWIIEGPLSLAQHRSLLKQVAQKLAPDVTVKPVRFKRGRMQAAIDFSRCRPDLAAQLSALTLKGHALSVHKTGPARYRLTAKPLGPAHDPEVQ